MKKEFGKEFGIVLYKREVKCQSTSYTLDLDHKGFFRPVITPHRMDYSYYVNCTHYGNDDKFFSGFMDLMKLLNLKRVMVNFNVSHFNDMEVKTDRYSNGIDTHTFTFVRALK
jgi:hypothetical protein